MQTITVSFVARKDVYGWLSPTGRFVTNRRGDKHHETAVRILGGFDELDADGGSVASDLLFRAGWTKIYASPEDGGASLGDFPLNEKQVPKFNRIASVLMGTFHHCSME